MRPTTKGVRPVANPVLTNMLVAFMNEASDYVALQAATPVPVVEESGTYISFPKGFWFKSQLERRAYGGGYARGGYKVSSDTYKTLQWGLEHPIADELRSTSQVPLDLERVGIEWLGAQSLIRKEQEFATLAFGASIWTNTDNNSATDWDSTGTPVSNVLTAKRTIKQATGKNANAMTCGEIVYDALLTNSEVTDLVKYTNSLTETNRRALIAAVLGLDFLFVSKAVANTANLAQTASLSPIIDDDALVHVVMSGASMMDVASMKTFVWQPGGGAGEIRTYRDDTVDSDILKHKEQWDMKLVSADTGYIFLDIV